MPVPRGHLEQTVAKLQQKIGDMEKSEEAMESEKSKIANEKEET